MEEVEKANSAAVESCHRVISILSQLQDQNQCRNLLVEQTGEAVHKFKKVVSLLNSSCGHARVRKSRKIQTPLPQNIFLENPIIATDDQHPKSLHHPHQEILPLVKNTLALGNLLWS
ncbi:protein WRKY1 [Sesamum angolense]|uniref:Protein WRKY1 n=1 Tax=Sesamum angolense TaxID=2727404 RepID=A0AAE1XB54_9LAMI|nr:protein WRKY1 [Sesamum angolense]